MREENFLLHLDFNIPHSFVHYLFISILRLLPFLIYYHYYGGHRLATEIMQPITPKYQRAGDSKMARVGAAEGY